MIYVGTYQKIEDIFTKGSFSRDQWNELMILFGMVLEFYRRSLFSVANVVLLALDGEEKVSVY